MCLFGVGLFELVRWFLTGLLWIIYCLNKGDSGIAIISCCTYINNSSIIETQAFEINK